MNRSALFDQKVLPEPNSGCWLWDGNARPDGYGYFWNGTKRIRAHRYSYEMHCGQIPDGQHVLHRCDNPACVNPDHLFLGTDATNNADRKQKGRVFRPRGSLSGRVKLTEPQIFEIRKDVRASRRIAADFGISHTQVLFIKSGKSWGWLEDAT